MLGSCILRQTGAHSLNSSIGPEVYISDDPEVYTILELVQKYLWAI
jgi:hypothetical protein